MTLTAWQNTPWIKRLPNENVSSEQETGTATSYSLLTP